MDVDARTISRWEKNETLIRPETAKLIVEKLLIPHQVLHNLNSSNPKPLRSGLIKEAARILPELNLVLHDPSGFYTGHINVLPLRFSSYRKIKNREMEEGSLNLSDLTGDLAASPLVFYFYSLYADSLANSYYLMNRLLSYFIEKKFKDYVFAGITYRKNKIEILREMGLKVIWQDKSATGKLAGATFMEGNLDMLLFGKMA